ncbi:hypothetical protein HMPREF9709_01806 [Helcococcus kunzii ATCC 51366]|uniref:Uncharacterized protein n=1 Tax=Helcococcus kunzii ATCC 51366 TaxID=883114 RepID=H3NR45_9FIRM|nr:hypothetical protein [Helcococcus kunzii]EHR31817.1 hypothetical protein HMPREF9709_01806 [Helcococcus kunzii ATCC 51366]
MKNMLKQDIDNYLLQHTELKKRIEKISKKYKLSDFVLVTENCKKYFETREENIDRLTGVIYERREDNFRLDIKSSEARLSREYLGFIHYILINKEVDNKVFYILYYHFLCFGKDYGYKLTDSSNCPFPTFHSEGLSPLAKDRIEIWNNKDLHVFKDLVSYFYESDVLFFNDFYMNFSAHHHATKNFSLIVNLIGIPIFVNKHMFFDIVELLIDSFVFNYKAIFMTEALSIYSTNEQFDKVKNSLVSLRIHDIDVSK